MRSMRFVRLICVLCVIFLLAASSPSVLASGEPEEAAGAAETCADAEELSESEQPEEAPVPEEEDGDPMALRLAMQLDGGSATFSNFTTRALNNETLRRGIDVSSWQGNINWSKVAAAGVEFVIIRAAYRTYGSSGALYKDSYFASNIAGAKAAGLKVGVYVFSQAITKAEAVEEADYLISLVKGYDIDLPLVFDFEYVSGGRLTSSLGKRVSTDICLAFCSRVESAGYDSMVYANASTLNGCLYPKEFSRVWLAHYTSKTSYSGSDYEYWQCSGSGSVNGISGDVDLDFWFEPAKPVTTVESLPFTDVSKSDWFYESVRDAYADSIVSGLSETQFGPNNKATRGQVVTMIHSMKGEPSWSTPASFADLTFQYYKNAIFWAAENGIVSGYDELTFGPDRQITREELVTILYRMAGEPAVSGDLSAFSDAARVQSYARDAMTWAVANDIVEGYAVDNTLRPQNQATRAEVCAILMRYKDM